MKTGSRKVIKINYPPLSRNSAAFPAVFGIFFLFCITFFIYCASQEVKDSDACFACHKVVPNMAKNFLHPLFKQGKCKACHGSYDEATHKEAVRPVLEVCMNCHPSEKLGRSHPVGQGIIDPNTNEMMSCVSSCHLPHGSDYKYQLPFKNNMDLCLKCHKEF